MRKLLPVLLALIGLGAGVGAGFFLRPPPEPAETAEASPCGDPAAPPPGHEAAGDHGAVAEGGGHGAAEGGHGAGGEEGEPAFDYVKLNNQFVVPVVDHGRVGALVILSLTLEVKMGGREAVYQREPKLRDSFLQVLFDHANAGGFNGNFTDANNMDLLRHALLEVARKTMGPVVSDVLVVDIVRQDS